MSFVYDANILRKPEAEITKYISALKAHSESDNITVAEMRTAKAHLEKVSNEFKTKCADNAHIEDIMTQIQIYYTNQNAGSVQHNVTALACYVRELEEYIRALEIITRDKMAACSSDIHIYNMLYENTKKLYNASLLLAQTEIKNMMNANVTASQLGAEHRAAIAYVQSPFKCKHVIDYYERRGIHDWDDPYFVASVYDVQCTKCNNHHGETPSTDFGEMIPTKGTKTPKSVKYRDFGAWVCHGIKTANKYQHKISIKKAFVAGTVEKLASQAAIAIESTDPVIESYKTSLRELIARYDAVAAIASTTP